MNNNSLQLNFSNSHQELYDNNKRTIKAKKIVTILNEYFNNKLGRLTLLDIGSSTGIITEYLSRYFKNTVGIDVDKKAVNFSQKKFRNSKLQFYLGDSMSLKFPNNSFDVITCCQVYEHVPDSNKLMSEIFRILKPGGICYFSAGNRFVLMEEHYHLPLLSAIPKFAANIYLNFTGKGKYYYENHKSLWGLKRLVAKFRVIDYTKKVIENPEKYFAIDDLTPGSLKHRLAKLIAKYGFWLCPNYLWLLEKKSSK